MIDEKKLAPVPDTFGNYALKGMEEITLPAEPGLFPLAPGWYVMLALVGLMALIWAVRALVRWHRNRYRREAVAQVKAMSMAEAPFLGAIIKRVALAGFDREVVAGLTGEAWLEFMQQNYDGPPMQDETGLLLPAATYHSPGTLDKDQFEALKARVCLWIMTHRTVGGVS